MNPVSTRLLGALTLLSVALCAWIAWPFHDAILTAMVLGIALHPLHQRVAALFSSRNLAAALSTFAAVLLVLVPAVVLGTLVTREIRDLYRQLQTVVWPELLDRPLEWIASRIGWEKPQLEEILRSRLESAAGFALRAGSSFLSGATTGVAQLFLSFVVLFFVFREGIAMRRWIEVVTPIPTAQVRKLTETIGAAITANVHGVLAVAAAQGTLTAIGLWFAGVPSPLFWGSVTMLTSTVPFIGSAAVWIPAALYLLWTGAWVKAIFFAAWGALVVGMADNVIRPLILSQHLRTNGLFVFFALLGGVEAFGFLGIFLGPVILSVTIALVSLWREHLRASHESPPPTS